MLSALKNRDFALLWAGMTVSLLGDGIYLVAIAWEAFRLLNTPTALSLVGVAWTLPAVLCFLLGGAISDRLDRRRVLVGAALGQAAAVGSIGVLASLHVLTLWVLLFPVAVYGAIQALFNPAFEAIIPTLVKRDQLLGASAVDQLARPLSLQLLGPALGGIVIALAGSAAAFLIDAVTFLVVAGTLLAMRVEPQRARIVSSGRRQIIEGLIFVRDNPWLWRTLAAAGLALLAFAGPSQVLLPFLVKNQLHAGSGVFGEIRAAGGIGAICAAIIVGQTGRPSPVLSAMFVAWALQCLALAGYALVAGAWVFAIISVFSGALGAVGNIVWGTLMKARVPNHLLGRVSSVDWFVSIGLVPVSFAITGPIAEAAGAQATMILAGVIASTTMLVFLALPGTRRGVAFESPA